MNCVGIVGAGLIGATIARCFRDAFPDVDLLLNDRSADNARFVCKNVPSVRQVASTDALLDCDLLFVCVPPASTANVVMEVAAATSKATIVDTASIKGPVIAEIEQTPEIAARFLGGHPMVGGKESGPSNFQDVFVGGASFVLCPTRFTPLALLTEVADVLKKAGYSTLEMDATHHDEVVAHTSHLPHLMSYALANTIASSVAEQDISDLASKSTRVMSGFASGNTEMWVEIFEKNASNLGKAVDGYILELLKLRADIRNEKLAAAKAKLDSGAKASDAISDAANGDG